MFGSQLVKLTDPRVVGTLERGEFLRRFSKLGGFAYHYTEPTVCYLPPIEIMTIGGPVVFQENSLLARYFSDSGAPGMAKNIDQLALRSEEHTSELQSLMRISYAVFCLKKQNNNHINRKPTTIQKHKFIQPYT